MSRCYQTVCRNEDDARAALQATDDVFDGIEEAAGCGRKRFAESLLWRFDDESPVVVERRLAALRHTGLFTEIREIPEEFFWSTKSYGV